MTDTACTIACYLIPDSDVFQQVLYGILMMSVVLIYYKYLVQGLVAVVHPTIGPASSTDNVHV